MIESPLIENKTLKLPYCIFLARCATRLPPKALTKTRRQEILDILCDTDRTISSAKFINNAIMRLIQSSAGAAGSLASSPEALLEWLTTWSGSPVVAFTVAVSVIQGVFDKRAQDGAAEFLKGLLELLKAVPSHKWKLHHDNTSTHHDDPSTDANFTLAAAACEVFWLNDPLVVGFMGDGPLCKGAPPEYAKFLTAWLTYCNEVLKVLAKFPQHFEKTFVNRGHILELVAMKSHFDLIENNTRSNIELIVQSADFDSKNLSSEVQLSILRIWCATYRMGTKPPEFKTIRKLLLNLLTKEYTETMKILGRMMAQAGCQHLKDWVVSCNPIDNDWGGLFNIVDFSVHQLALEALGRYRRVHNNTSLETCAVNQLTALTMIMEGSNYWLFIPACKTINTVLKDFDQSITNHELIGLIYKIHSRAEGNGSSLIDEPGENQSTIFMALVNMMLNVLYKRKTSGADYAFIIEAACALMNLLFFPNLQLRADSEHWPTWMKGPLNDACAVRFARLISAICDPTHSTITPNNALATLVSNKQKYLKELVKWVSPLLQHFIVHILEGPSGRTEISKTQRQVLEIAMYQVIGVLRSEEGAVDVFANGMSAEARAYFRSLYGEYKKSLGSVA